MAIFDLRFFGCYVSAAVKPCRQRRFPMLLFFGELFCTKPTKPTINWWLKPLSQKHTSPPTEIHHKLLGNKTKLKINSSSTLSSIFNTNQNFDLHPSFHPPSDPVESWSLILLTDGGHSFQTLPRKLW
jgi:hypothetical protein